ncbi:MAG: CusA/CzcA family heavy metal efflux RND transporter [Candidatus Accumulibacter sp.]|uniref:efflux RND transporter permease subunit n=1 Tax=Accumulibacter sp. TaxID=2053492 RepID=UPI0028789738|nr:CusA/CzcA family heavy metal efflux RND transporter [Accumulibacter sp.]MDS4015295.1 CusA/CzcA family heavy metal efflux RND transporter [Accumulibacter sp.]
MIARIIAWSARNIFLVMFATAFAAAAGIWSLRTLPVDAIPDLSDVQVIVLTEFPGQAPQVVEDQVTFPLTSAMLTVPRSRVVRGFSFFGVSFVYVIFEDGVDPYWARSRVLEYLNAAAARLPDGVTPALGPDATGVGWVYQYALKGKDLTLAELRSLQDWVMRFAISRAEGVSEVASAGGFVKQYIVTVDPLRMRALGVTLQELASAVQASNMDTGGRTVELSEFEFMVRSRGYLRGVEDLELVPVRTQDGVPLLLRDVARIELAPDERRGITELDGEGEVASGIVLQRVGSNALDVIENAKAEIAVISESLPEGVEVVPVYDRSNLILAAIDTLRSTLLEESLVVAAVTFLFLLHVRSALVAVIMLPVGILIAFAAMRALGIGANIMSLGGIAIAIGAMIDAAIVMIENAHKHLERAEPGAPRINVLIAAAAEVGPALFFSLLIITVSFLPIFTLEGQEGRLFGPLAWTKTFAMAAAALLSVTLVPALMVIFVRGKITAEQKNPVNRFLIAIYRPVIAHVLKAPVLTILIALGVLAATVWPARQLGSEFMPALDEGTLMYMPTTLPGLSVTKAAELLQMQDRIIRAFPEVETVFGKAGRAMTATDPAPTEMFETIIQLKPREAWRPGVTIESLRAEMDAALQFPGVSNAWTMPIRARIDMLATGIRTPVGVKIFGTDLAELERIARAVEAVLRNVPGTSSAYAERVIGGYYLDIVPDRARLARYGLTIADVQEVIAVALGAQAMTQTVEGRERYTVALRYPPGMRQDPDAIAREVMVALPGGGFVPLGEIARIERTRGATSIRTENGQLAVYIFVDITGRDLGGYVADAQAAVAGEVTLPPGYSIGWSGQFEFLERAQARLALVVPMTLAVIFLLLFLNFRRLPETLIVMLSLPFALVGGVWFMWWMGFNLSVAAAAGFIALAGVAAETGVIMLIYLDHAFAERQAEAAGANRAFGRADLEASIMTGAVERVRPKMMTVVAIMAGLLPILWADGTGSEVMSRIAVPMIGGMVSSTVLTLVVIPAVYALVKGRRLASPGAAQAGAGMAKERKPELS